METPFRGPITTALPYLSRGSPCGVCELMWEPSPDSAEKSNVSGHKCVNNGVRVGRHWVGTLT